MSPVLVIDLPIRTQSEANLRQHWSVRHKRVAAQRAAVLLHLNALGVPEPPLLVTLVRLAPNRLDSDNLAGAFKGVRDGIAEWLKIDDGDDRVQWRYSQEQRGKAKGLMAFTRGGQMKRLSEITMRLEIDRP